MVMVAEPLRGFAEALVLAEASVGAGAEDAVVVEVDLAIGSRFKLASTYRKDGYYAKR